MSNQSNHHDLFYPAGEHHRFPVFVCLSDAGREWRPPDQGCCPCSVRQMQGGVTGDAWLPQFWWVAECIACWRYICGPRRVPSMCSRCLSPNCNSFWCLGMKIKSWVMDTILIPFHVWRGGSIPNHDSNNNNRHAATRAYWIWCFVCSFILPTGWWWQTCNLTSLCPEVSRWWCHQRRCPAMHWTTQCPFQWRWRFLERRWFQDTFVLSQKVFLITRQPPHACIKIIILKTSYHHIISSHHETLFTSYHAFVVILNHFTTSYLILLISSFCIIPPFHITFSHHIISSHHVMLYHPHIILSHHIIFLHHIIMLC